VLAVDTSYLDYKQIAKRSGYGPTRRLFFTAPLMPDSELMLLFLLLDVRTLLTRYHSFTTNVACYQTEGSGKSGRRSSSGYNKKNL